MKSNEMKKYTSPSLELLKADREDVISTSGFLGGDHVIGAPEAQSYEVMKAATAPYQGANDAE